jgi:hypothetical protein
MVCLGALRRTRPVALGHACALLTPSLSEADGSMLHAWVGSR